MSCALNPETWVDVWKFWKSDTLNEFSSQAYKLVELWDMNVLWHSLQACKFKQELSWEEENILKLQFSLLHVLQDMKSSWLDTLTHSHTDQDIYTILQKPSLHYASLHFLNTQWIVLNLSYCCMHYFNMLSNLDLPTSYSKFVFFLFIFDGVKRHHHKFLCCCSSFFVTALLITFQVYDDIFSGRLAQKLYSRKSSIISIKLQRNTTTPKSIFFQKLTQAM